jgi:hypothetical protein
MNESLETLPDRVPIDVCIRILAREVEKIKQREEEREELIRREA